MASKIVYKFTIPETLRGNHGVASIKMRELTSREEIDASRVGGLDFTRAQFEATKRSICMLDSRPVSIAGDEIDRFWEDAGPRLRALLISAFNRLHSVTQEESKDFFASQEVETSG